MDIVKTISGLIEDVYNRDIDSLDELQRELIYLRSELEQLTLTDVSHQREKLLSYHRFLQEHLSLDLSEVWVDEHLKR
jgi:hypothetical protein